ncbi:MAG: peptide-methionine (S)-S-oxide reductase MsrA [Methylotenera sp.]|nr:peptide-methionine (S)-S-oxide reductase MsrA [Methylotenera sp.]
MYLPKLPTKPLIWALLLGFSVLAWQLTISAKEAPTIIAQPAQDNLKVSGPTQTAVIAGGCFWGVQGVFEHVKGVRKVVSGYSGGAQSTAQYDTVSSGTTGHAEAVQITFNPAEVSYGELLQIFFSVVHDPTLLNRQGPDKGTQYRSAIFYMNDTQKNIAESYVQQLNKTHAFANNIVTKIDAFKAFYPAENYHQDFLINNPYYPYIVVNDMPKIENLKRIFPQKYASQPILVNPK